MFASGTLNYTQTTPDDDYFTYIMLDNNYDTFQGTIKVTALKTGDEIIFNFNSLLNCFEVTNGRFLFDYQNQTVEFQIEFIE